MGVVYLGVARDGNLVAVKVLRPELAEDPEFRTRFSREVATLLRVKGVCTVRVIEADTESPRPFLVTEYADGPSLAEYVDTNGPLNAEMLYGLATGLAEALTAIHAAGVVHRDLKPSNVLLTKDGPKVIDFGIATALDATSLTKTGTTIGSAGFMAPEQIMGQAGTAADIFAWAVTVGYAASGHPPFGTGASDAILYRIMHAEPDIAAVPASLRPQVEAALAKEPQNRPTAHELLSQLINMSAQPDSSYDAPTQTVLSRTWRPAVSSQDTVSRHDFPAVVRPAVSSHDVPAVKWSARRRPVLLSVALSLAVLVAVAGTAIALTLSGHSAGTHDAALPAGGSATTKACTATIGFEGPITGPVAVLGAEQLHFAQLALAMDNAANKTKITLVQGDTQLNPAQATTVTQQFISNSNIVAVVGPAGSQEVGAVGGPFGRAGMAFISGSATNATLTTGKYPTFFRVVSKDSVQGPQDANYIVKNLHPKALMIVDDQESYSTDLVSAMMPLFQAAGIKVDHESVSQKVTDFSSLVAKVTPTTSVVVLPWQIAADAQQFGRNLGQQHKTALIFGTDGLFSPGTFTITGSYVSSFGPDITAMPADAAIASAAQSKYGSFGTFGPPVFAATRVVDKAIAAVCKAGQTPTRSNVLAAIKQTNESTSILGQPISFDSHGDLVNGKFFLFKISSAGKYQLIPSS
jgi:ABC-type branched-subunit amino acid transport system substrate-binding protein